MSTFVALLRGVNVGGARKLPMAELRESLTTLGLTDVRTYVQSGNVVFGARGDDAPDAAAHWARALEERIASEWDLSVPAIVLGAEELRRIVAANPFATAPGTDTAVLHATFFARSIDADRFAGLTLPAAEGEEAALGERVVYLRLRHGYGRTKLGNAYFEKALGAPATTRNWRTVLTVNGMVAERP